VLQTWNEVTSLLVCASFCEAILQAGICKQPNKKYLASLVDSFDSKALTANNINHAISHQRSGSVIAEALSTEHDIATSLVCNLDFLMGRRLC
jgi:hypothetical protein